MPDNIMPGIVYIKILIPGIKICIRKSDFLMTLIISGNTKEEIINGLFL
jgi:hypothetical protein